MTRKGKNFSVISQKKRKRDSDDESQDPFDFNTKKPKVSNDANDADASEIPITENVEQTNWEQEIGATEKILTKRLCNESNETFAGVSTIDFANNASSVPSTPERLKVAIIGAGISGLGAAVVLQKAGADVLILEADSRPGGRMRSINFPAEGRLKSVSVDIGANVLIDCSDEDNSNPLFDLARFLEMKTMEVRCATGWDCPLATKMINSQGKVVNPRIAAKMYFLHQALFRLGMVKVIRDSGFDIPALSYVTSLESKSSATTEVPTKTRKRTAKRKWKVNGKASSDVPKRGIFDFGDGEIEDVMEDIFTKLSIQDIFEFGKKEYRTMRSLNLSKEEESVLECIVTRLYGNVLPTTHQNVWDLAYGMNSPMIGLDNIYKQIEGPNERNISNLSKQIKTLISESKKMKPNTDEVFDSEDRLICDSSSRLIDYLVSKVNILYNKQCRFVYYKDHGVVIDCIDDGVRQSIDADFCIITVSPNCLREDWEEGICLQISPQMTHSKSTAIHRVAMPGREVQAQNKVILRFNKIFWEPNLTSMMNTETRVSILNYHKVGKENVLCIYIWANSHWNSMYYSDEELCAKCCKMLKQMFPRTYKSNIKLVNSAVSRWNEDPLIRCSQTGLAVGSTSNDFVLFGTPLPSVENPRVCFAGEATIDVLNGPIQTAHGAFQTGVREARRIASKGKLEAIPCDKKLVAFITTDSEIEEEVQDEEESEQGIQAVEKQKCTAQCRKISTEVAAHNTKQ